MGYSSYSSDSRTLRATSLNYSASASLDSIFTQAHTRQIHESMSPKGILLRECRDSIDHPSVVPILLGLDVTGSMGSLPKYLVVEGLPKIMSKLIQKGIDASLLFTAVGDHESDRYPFQVGQFESGDLELDTWLTRSYLEGGGGGNQGESYMLPWYFAAKKVVTDAFDKRGQKGFLFTIGDEPVLNYLPANAIVEVFGDAQANSYTTKELLELAQEKFNVFHINIEHTGQGHRSTQGWRDLLGQNLLVAQKVEDVSNLIIETVFQVTESRLSNTVINSPLTDTSASPEVIL